MIKHIKCNIFESGADIILHQVNCQGVMGSGIAKQVKEQYPKVYEEYKKICNKNNPHSLLGLAQSVVTYKDYGTTFRGIFNLFAQENYGYDGKCYTNYDALHSCLDFVNNYVVKGTTIAIPYLMGCARGGGDWNVVYQMIEETFDEDVNILICEYGRG